MKSGRGGEAVRGERARRPPQKARAQAGNGYWPRNARCAVCLTFDFDADSRFGDQPDSGLTTRSRGVYGARVGIYRILDLLRRYDLPATFFVPGYTAETYRDATVAIVRGGHELANHGYFHERPTDFSGDPEAELAILHRGSDALAAFAGSRPLGYRSPAWDLNPGSPKLLSRAGFIYDSSLMDDERPYLIDTGESAPLVELPIDWVLDDFTHFQFSPPVTQGLSAPSKVLEIWLDEFDGYYETGGCFILTMHPQVIGRHHRLKVLERLIQYMMRRRRRLFISNCLDVAHHALNHSPLSAG
jgi:peptidoglycan/xylan/chitin deacetylase (PgdA/CDA1 family)